MSDRTPEEKIEAVAEQIRLCEAGIIQMMHCPYCLAFNKEGEKLCCTLFAYAAMAIMDRRDIQERMDLAAKIADKSFAN